MALHWWFDSRIDDRKSKAESAVAELGGIAHILYLGITAIALWAERRRSRRALANLNDDQLRDVAITRPAAQRESAKPFWIP